MAQHTDSTRGVTLLELMIVVAVLATIVSIASSYYRSALEHARNAKAISDLKVISNDVDVYWMANGELPAELYDVGHGNRRDPWGNPYMYLNMQTGSGSAARFVQDNGLIDPALVEVWEDLRLSSRGDAPEVPDPLDEASIDVIKRKDQFLFPINSDYDLFSLGPNRKAFTNIASDFSLDDVIRANDGGFFGVASTY